LAVKSGKPGGGCWSRSRGEGACPPLKVLCASSFRRVLHGASAAAPYPTFFDKFFDKFLERFFERFFERFLDKFFERFFESVAFVRLGLAGTGAGAAVLPVFLITLALLIKDFF
jgi:hypothetical protein